MGMKRQRHSIQFKFQLALAADQGRHTLKELPSQHGVHPNQIGQWKRHLLEQGPQLFAGPGWVSPSDSHAASPSNLSWWSKSQGIS